MAMDRHKSNPAGAYTLVELLVVIGVLSIAFSILFVGFGSGDGAQLSSSQRTLSGLFKAARAQAILKNTEVRLIIHNDSSEPGKFHRFAGLIYDADPGVAKSWIALDKGIYLPKNIYFDPNSSETNSGANNADWTAANNTMQINFPSRTGQSGTIGTSYLFYEFNDNGTFSDPGAYLVFRVGQFIPGSAAPNFPADKANIKAAFILRPVGTATLVNNPADID